VITVEMNLLAGACAGLAIGFVDFASEVG
jgi:hypothetical protein